MTESATGSDGERRRIVVAIDPAGVRAAPIRTAAALARKLDMELVALVVEEQSWLRLASLPFARELQRASGQWRTFDAPEVERLFRQHASRAQAMLRRLCDAPGARFSVVVTRGSYPQQALENRGSTDWLILDRGHAADSGHGSYRRVVTAFDGSPATQRSLATAVAIAHDIERPLRIVLIDKEPAHLLALRAQARSAAGAEPVEFDQMTGGSASAVLARLAGGPGSLLVITPELAERAAIVQPALAGATILLVR